MLRRPSLQTDLLDVNQTFRSRRQRAHPANMTRLERMIRFRARWRTLDRPFPERAISVGALRLPDLRSLDARYKRMGRHAKESFRRFRAGRSPLISSPMQISTNVGVIRLSRLTPNDAT